MYRWVQFDGKLNFKEAFLTTLYSHKNGHPIFAAKVAHFKDGLFDFEFTLNDDSPAFNSLGGLDKFRYGIGSLERNF